MLLLKLVRCIIVFKWLIIVQTLCGQVTDNFSDDDFTLNPTWAGNDSKFVINSGFLKLQAPALAENAYLSTPSTAIHNATWEFFVRMDFNPSSTNYARVYLTSSQSDLTSTLDGYYVMVGNTDDEISLYKQTGSTRAKIIDGLNGRVNIDPVLTKIKVTRDGSGNWELFSDVGSTGTYVVEGTVNDVTHTVSSYMGVQCTYTSTRSSHFWFDDFIITGSLVPDLNPPTLTGIQIVNQDSLLITYNEVVDNISAEDVSHYIINNNIGNPTNAILQIDNKSVLITLPTPLLNGFNYSAQVSGIKDPDGNLMNSSSLNFLYFIPQPVSSNDIIVSEFMADPTPVIGLPEAEFVELYNRSANPVDLLGWKLTDGSSNATLPNYILLPNSYCIITSATSSGLFPGSLGVSNFPSLNNTGDNIVVKNNQGTTIDSIHYATAWYHSDEKKDGGWSLEIIDPENLCGEENNWSASINSQGGTPGLVNSVNDNNPDTVAPKILSTQVENQNTVEIVLDEKMDGGPVAVMANPSLNFVPAIYSASLRQLTLTSEFPFLHSTPYTITISNAKDCAGNSLIDNSFQFVLTEAAQPGDILVNEVLFNPKTGGVDFVELYNNTLKYISLKKWSISNYDGTSIVNSKSLGTLANIIPPKSYRVITSDSSILNNQYSNTVKSNCIISTLPSFPDDTGSVALVDSLGTIIDYLIYNESYHLSSLSIKEGVSLERISFMSPSSDSSNWRSATVYENFATPGYKNSASYPFITDFTISSANVLTIIFSSPLESLSGQTLANYSLDQNIGNPSEIELRNGDSTVQLTFPQPFINGLTLTLSISGIKDPDEKTLPTVTLGFLYFVPSPISPNDVVVSEFMADPAPVLGLPESEFVELFNRSSNPIDLMGWKLSDGSMTSTLPRYILLPYSRCVVTSNAASGLFPGSIGVSGFPSLNNTGDNIIVKDSQGIIVDSITYSQNWYHSNEKKDGGWSIEIIDPENFCGEEDNWTASINPLGGTPGSINSVNGNNPDVAAPKILFTQIKNQSSVEILFNEKMDSDDVSVVGNPLLSFGPSGYSNSLRQLTITSMSEFQVSVPYTITLLNAKDCSGNSLIDNTFQFVLAEPASPEDILINEILFNPKSGGVDFIEIYNSSSKYIDLKKWSISNYDGTSIVNSKSLGALANVMPPKSYRVVTSDSSILNNHYPGTVKSNYIISSLPSFPDNEGSVALVDSLGIIIDYFVYKESYHLSTLPVKEGVSLERIAFNGPSNDPGNWRSAAPYENYATPGYKNSASYPFLLSFSIKNSNSLLVSFSSPIEPGSAQSKNSFFLNQGMGNPAVIELQNASKDVLLTFSHDFSNGLNYILTISGIKDPDDKLLPSISLNFLYFIPSPVSYKDIIVSEFMADPAPVVGLPEAEFIELFNRSSNPVNLLGWRLRDGSTAATLPQYILLPDARCVITTNSTSYLFPGSIGLSGFPSLNNTSDNIILESPKGVIIDSITYFQSWYHSDEKQDGGWSLEIVDPENGCGEEGNWTASENLSGGTPGAQNSVHANNPDLTPPLIQACVVTSVSTLEVFFNEKMDGLSIPAVMLNPSITISLVQYHISLRKLVVHTNEAMELSTPYVLSLSNAFDCSGNKLEKNSYSFILPEAAQPGEISINEILFNPKSGGVDFVEIYNRGSKYLSIKNWKLSNYDDGLAINQKEIIMTNPVIAPNSFLVFTPDAAILKSHYPRAMEEVLIDTTLPSLPDDEGTVALVDSSGNFMDFFSYRDDYHIAFLKDDDGVSLERISLETETNSPDNWRSASQAENFATPGYRNSATLNTTGIIVGEVVVEPEIFSPESQPNDFTKISYRFEHSGKVANAAIYDHQGRTIKVLANNEVLGVEGFFRWDGDRDDGGRARAGYYVAIVEVFDISGKVNSFKKRVVIAYR